MEYNYDKLKGKIVEVFGTQEKFAVNMGISPASLSAKLHNLTGFTQKEILTACNLLGIDLHRFRYIFLPIKFRKSELYKWEAQHGRPEKIRALRDQRC